MTSRFTVFLIRQSKVEKNIPFSNPFFINVDYGGTVFSMSIDGSDYQEIHQFEDATGTVPYTALLPHDGRLYGATYNGACSGAA